MRFSERLRGMGACRAAWQWVERRGFGLKKAWDHCGNEGWMLWWLWNLEDEGVPMPLSRLKKEFLALVKGERGNRLIEFRADLREAWTIRDIFNTTAGLDNHFGVEYGGPVPEQGGEDELRRHPACDPECA